MGYLGAAIRHDTSWQVMAYNADFTPDSEYQTLDYLTHEGYENYKANLADSGRQVWDGLRETIREFSPDVVASPPKPRTSSPLASPPG